MAHLRSKQRNSRLVFGEGLVVVREICLLTVSDTSAGLTKALNRGETDKDRSSKNRKGCQLSGGSHVFSGIVIFPEMVQISLLERFVWVCSHSDPSQGLLLSCSRGKRNKRVCLSVRKSRRLTTQNKAKFLQIAVPQTVLGTLTSIGTTGYKQVRGGKCPRYSGSTIALAQASGFPMS